jgi:zinc transport system substrate-binding protein
VSRPWCTAACSILLAAQWSAAGAETVRVSVSIPPQREVVERVGGERVVVEVLIPPGRSPVTYEPSPRQLADLTRADLLVPVGVPFERQVVDRIASLAPGLAICGAARHVDAPQPVRSGSVGDGDATPHHHHQGVDPHFWLDPIAVIEHASATCECLCEADPVGCEAYRTGLRAYRAELEALDRDITRQLEPLAGRTMLVFHPAFGHFAARYGLRQLAIENEGKEPTARHLAGVIEEAERLATRVVFVQPQFASASVEAVADAIGGRVVEIDPLAPDLSANLRRIAATVAAALSPTDGGAS